MEENDYKTENTPELREKNLYQTGSTRPPKSYGGIIAVLIASVIFLGGIVSVLGLMNIRIFQQMNRSKQENTGVQFASEPTDEAQTPQDTTPDEQEQGLELEIAGTPDSVANVIQEGGLSLQDIYTKAIDSVVSISCATGTGTGVVLSSDGYIVTNAHVVEGGGQLSVLFTDQTTLPATLVGMDTVSDLAVLYVQAEDLTPAEFGDSSVLRVGDSVVAIGDPLGIELRGTMTNGIVSAINRDITTGGRTMTLIQTNAALNSGNSGGPLLNCYGQVVGINTMKIGDYMNDAGVEGLGFAIPSTTVKEVVDQLVAQGYVSGRPALGFQAQTVTVFDQMYYHIPQGVYITQVEEGSSADSLGLMPGDILLQFAGTRILDTATLDTCLYSLDAGETVDILIYRSGQQYTAQLTLDEAN